jgi:hypothetical protein
MSNPRSSTRLAKIIGHDVQCCQEGIQIDLKLAPILTNWFGKLTVISGDLALQLFSISHQTFKTRSIVSGKTYLKVEKIAKWVSVSQVQHADEIGVRLAGKLRLPACQ